MLVGLDGEAWAGVFTAIFTGLIATGVFLAWIQLLDTHRARDAEIVHKLMQQWDSPRMVDAHRLIASFKDPQAMAEAFGKATARQTGDFYLFTYNLNFWEQVSLAYGDSRDTLKLVDTMFGDELWRAWSNWQPVLELRYGANSNVGGKFRETFQKLQRKAKWKLRRRELWLWLRHPLKYYDVPLEERSARRQRWKTSRPQ